MKLPTRQADASRRPTCPEFRQRGLTKKPSSRDSDQTGATAGASEVGRPVRESGALGRARRRQGSRARHWPAYLQRAGPRRWSDNEDVRPKQPGALGARGGPHHLGGMPGGLGGDCEVLETTGHRRHAADRSAPVPTPRRPVPRPASAAITALPGPAWIRSRARPSAPRAAALPPASAPTTMGPGPGVQLSWSLSRSHPGRSRASGARSGRRTDLPSPPLLAAQAGLSDGLFSFSSRPSSPATPPPFAP